MNILIAASLVLSLSAHAPEPATSSDPVERNVSVNVVQQPIAAETAPVLIPVEARSVAPGAEAAAQPPRGSFWWVVGAIVVAGIILAIVL